MTLLTTDSEIQYSGLIGQDTFAYTFRVDEKEDMNVSLDNVPVAQGDFTMTGLGSPTGGTVILNTPLVADAIVLLFRDVPSTQEVDYQPFDAFPAETHEFALDKLTMLVQQNDTDVQRSLRFPPGDTSDPVLPDAPTRIDKYLAFDNAGDITVLTGTTGDPNSMQKPTVANSGNLVEFDSNKNGFDSGETATGLRSDVDANTAAVVGKVDKAGDTMTGQLKGITAIANEDMMIKSAVDSAIATALATIAQQLATAWVSFDGQTGTVLDSYNIGSVVRNSNGKYTITFSAAMDDANYVITTAAQKQSGAANNSTFVAIDKDVAVTVNGFDIETTSSSDTLVDDQRVCVAVHGGKT